jgi:urease accessory protein
MGFDHMLAMMSVGLWGAFLGKPLVHALPVVFPLMMVLGAAVGMVAIPMPWADLGVAVSVVVLGVCIASALRARVWVACVIVALFALFHGYSHGAELPSAADPIGYSVGFVLATGLLHLSGIGVGLLNGLRYGAWVTRGLGAIAGASGCWFVYRALGQ